MKNWDKPWKMHQSPRSDFLSNDNLADCCDSPHVFDRWCVNRCMMPLDLPPITGMSGDHGAHEYGSPPTTVGNHSRPQVPQCRQLPLGQAFATASTDEEIDVMVNGHLSSQGFLHVRTYGYRDGYVGQRSVTLSQPDLPQWRAKLRELWQDHYLVPPFLIFTIRPPPTRTRNTISVIVQMGSVPVGQVLVLVQLIYGSARPEEPSVTSLPYFTSRSVVFDSLHIRPSLQRTAILRQGFLAWLTGFPQRVHDGDYLRVLLDDPGSDERVEDFTSLTQTAMFLEGSMTFRTLPGLPNEYLALRRERLDQELQQLAIGGERRLVLDDPDGWMRFANAMQQNEVAPVAVIFYGLLFRSIGSRRVLLPGLHFPSIEEALHTIWPEYDGLEKRAFLVHPQPSLGWAFLTMRPFQ